MAALQGPRDSPSVCRVQQVEEQNEEQAADDQPQAVVSSFRRRNMVLEKVAAPHLFPIRSVTEEPSGPKHKLGAVLTSIRAFPSMANTISPSFGSCLSGAICLSMKSDPPGTILRIDTTPLPSTSCWRVIPIPHCGFFLAATDKHVSSLCAVAGLSEELVSAAAAK